jgi:hypothetical protein
MGSAGNRPDRHHERPTFEVILQPFFLSIHIKTHRRLMATEKSVGPLLAGARLRGPDWLVSIEVGLQKFHQNLQKLPQREHFGNFLLSSS